ncbi:MAG: arginine--tRNA ligase, partial [Chloroflexi bacterium]|nr:arginine--tRNA ligase [Chloroflexota bacterium]
MKLIPAELARSVEQSIQAAQAAGDLPAFEIPEIAIHPPKRAEQGDYAAAVAMQLAKPAKLNPFYIATYIANHFVRPDFIGAVEVVHPGFINFRLDLDWLRLQTEIIIAEGEKLAQLDLGAGKRAQVEFVSANPTGPVTVGRSRGGIIGDTMARLLEAASYKVNREYYFNNAGNQMRMLGNSLRLRYLEALGRPIEIPDDKTFYQGDYLIDFAQELVKEHADSWVDADWTQFKAFAEAKMFVWIKDTLARVRIEHETFFNENSLYENKAVWNVLAELEKRGLTYKAAARENTSPEELEKAGGKGEAIWFRSTSLGDAEDRVLVKNTGEPTYTLPDIAYHIDKLNRGFDLLINVLGSDHYTEAQVVRYGLTALGYETSKLHVILNQLVRTVRDGKEVRMSTRRGVFDTLDELIDQTSADAVRYMLLARSADSQLNFDLDLAVKQSNENPVYNIQYAYVRCAGIFREAAVRGVSDDGADLSLLGEPELSFLRK